MVELFVTFVNEREGVRKRRAACLPQPWTADPILQKYHFCNIRREDDRGTRELRALQNTLRMDIMFLPEFYTLARLYNSANTTRLHWLSGPAAVKAHRDQGNKIFHVAYVVSTCGKRMDKVDYVTRVAADVGDTHIRTNTCWEAFTDLRWVDGLGSFLAGQVVADLKYTPYLLNAPDWHTFAVMGPGSKKGLDLIYGGSTTERNFMTRLMTLRRAVEDRIPPLHNQDLQNCLCEFSKYVRYKENLSGRRRTYAV